MTIYEELGGAEAVSAAVDLFYRRVLSDRLLSPYFEGVDTAHLRAHQRAFMTAAFDGPQAYSGASMTAAHAGRGITKSAFGLVVGHLVATLKELGVSPIS